MVFWQRRNGVSASSRSRLRHAFVIGPLCDSELFAGKARLYYCIRCRWRFLVGEGRIAVLDDGGTPMTGNESSLRFASFEEGPCPALTAFAADAIALINARPPSSRRLDEDAPRPLLRVVSRTPRLVPPASLDVNA